MNESEKQYTEKTDALKTQSKGMRKKLVVALIAVTAAILVLVLVLFLIESLSRPKLPELPEYEFYPTYQGNIMEYDRYLDLDRQVYYSEMGTTTSITEENREEFDPAVLFLYDYVQSIIAGDHTRYNQFFSDSYFKECDPQTPFSPQMLYRIVITYQSTEEEAGDKLITYRLDYMIFENDGTFRRDIESDASRPQIVTLRVTPNGEIAIEKLITNYIS